MTGSHWVRDGGYFVGPMLITNTHSVGAAHEGAVRWILQTYREAWENNHLWAMPVVAETYDGVLNDINGLHVRPEHALKALASAGSGPVREGNVGGGAGMVSVSVVGVSPCSNSRLLLQKVIIASRDKGRAIQTACTKEKVVSHDLPAVASSRARLGPLGLPPRALVRRWLLRRGLLSCAPPCGGLVSASRPRAVSRSGGLRPAGNERCWILVAFVACTPWPRILMNSPG